MTAPPTAPRRKPLLAQLNQAQREAVTTTRGPLLVLAGAGTGKTRVITFRVAHLLERGVPPQAVLGLTFTNKAAREMRERVARLLGKKPEGLTLSTFHSLGARIARAEAKHLGFRGNFNIYDTGDQVALVRTILRDIRGAGGPVNPRAVLAEISRAKNNFQGPEDLLDEAGDSWQELVAQVYRRYASSLEDMNCMDFDDLIFRPARLLESSEEVTRRYRARWRFLLVDEYQDTNGAQYRFLQSLVGPERNVCVVGDDDQSIYAFRGAQVDKILEFERDFPGARVVKLEENYRSTKAVLDLANAVIAGSARRYPKELRSTMGDGAPVRQVAAPDEEREVDYVLGELLALHTEGVPFNAMAVLIRAANQARPFEEKLRLRRVPYVLVGGQSYFDRKEIRDVLAYWMVAANPSDDFSLLRILNVPRRGFGSQTVRKLTAMVRSEDVACRCVLSALRMARDGAGDFTRPVRTAAGLVVDLFDAAAAQLSRGEHSRMTRDILEQASYREALTELYPDPLTRKNRWGAVDDLLESVERWQRESPGESFHDLLASLRLDHEDPRSGEKTHQSGVSLMTLHSAKGLEFPHVFLPGVEEDLLPHKRSVDDGDAAVDEERRLFYVGITRARRRLTISHARARSARGRSYPRKPSRFLQELSGRGLVEVETFRPEQEATEADAESFREMYKKLRKRP